MNSNQIKYIIFSGPIGSGKTTQMSYFGSKYKEFTVIEGGNGVVFEADA